MSRKSTDPTKSAGTIARHGRDTVTAHGELHGTHDGDLADLPATGKQVRVQYVIFTRIAHGKVAEYWYQLDVLGALHQLDLFSLDDATTAADSETPTPKNGY